MYNGMHAAFGPQHWWPGDTAIEIIVGAILTQNTAWSNVERAIEALKRADRLTLPALHKMTAEELAELIRPAGTFRVKARRLKAFTNWLQESYGGNLDEMLGAEASRLREQLLGVSGIGPETADAILLYAAGVPTFMVDAYTQRILRRHYVIERGTDYEATKAVFQRHLPADTAHYGEYHALLVATGKRCCRPKARCDQCPLRDLPHDPDR
jgi:endonuclease-3 related protein